MTNVKKTLLLTGASGVVGQALLEKLTDYSVICLVHRTPVEGANVTSIKGDISKPRLGLSKEDFEGLAKKVDYVVHSAANTSFGESKDATFKTNVDGTRHVLQLA